VHTHTAYIYKYKQVYLDRLNPFDAFIYEQSICIGCGSKCSCALGLHIGLYVLFSPPGCCSTAGYMFCCCLFLTISVRPTISTSTGPIFARFTGLLDLWLLMISQKVVFSIPQGTLPRQPKFVGFIHRTEFGWYSANGGVREVVHVGRWTQAVVVHGGLWV